MSVVVGKVALITGSAVGIGKGLAQGFLRNGAKGVYLVDINEEKGKQTEKSLQQEFGVDNVLFSTCDVTSNEQLEASFQRCMDRYGHIDVVCNNAGVLNEFNREQTLAVNLKAQIEGTYLAVKYMGTKNGGKGGVVVNTSSQVGFRANPYAPVYAATKYGIIGFTRSVAFEPDVIDNNVRVVTICPGKVDTQMQHDAVYNTRYEEHMKEYLKAFNVPSMGVDDVTSVVLQLIADKSMNGTASLIRYGEDFKNIPLQSLE